MSVTHVRDTRRPTDRRRPVGPALRFAGTALAVVLLTAAFVLMVLCRSSTP